MLSIRACATPEPDVIKIAIPKRLARIRRSVEPKRMDAFKKLQESLKSTAKQETELIKELLNKSWWDDEEDDMN